MTKPKAVPALLHLRRYAMPPGVGIASPSHWLVSIRNPTGSYDHSQNESSLDFRLLYPCVEEGLEEEQRSKRPFVPLLHRRCGLEKCM